MLLATALPLTRSIKAESFKFAEFGLYSNFKSHKRAQGVGTNTYEIEYLYLHGLFINYMESSGS
jgi:hypothetical protein